MSDFFGQLKMKSADGKMYITDVAINVADKLTERQYVIYNFIRQNIAVNTKAIAEE